MKAICLAFIMLLLYSPAMAGTGQVLLDEVVASVNDTAITRSQVEQEARFILVQEGYHWSGPLSAALLEKVLVRYIAKELIYRELEKRSSRNASDMPAREPSDELTELLREFRAKFKSDEYYRLFLELTQMSEETLAAHIWKNHRIEQYMQRRMETLSRPTQTEVDEEMKKRLKITTVAENEKAQLRDVIERELASRKYKETLEKWIDELRGRSRVLQTVHFDREAGKDGGGQ